MGMPKGHEPMAETTARRPGVLVFRFELQLINVKCRDRSIAADGSGRRSASGMGKPLGRSTRAPVLIPR